MEEPFKASLSLFGHRWLGSPGPLDRLLRALEKIPAIAPDRWSLVDGTAVPYDRSAILASVDPCETQVLYLQRSAAPAWEGSVDLMKGSSIALEAEVTGETYALLFELAEALAEALEPDFGSVGRSAFPQGGDADARDRTLLSYSSGVAPIDYGEHGPLGLGERTYLGPHFVQQFGLATLRSVPAVVRDVPWGGLVIDRLEHPWKAPAMGLVAPWRAAMAPLTPTEVFASARVFDDGNVLWKMGRRCNLGPLAQPPEVPRA